MRGIIFKTIICLFLFSFFIKKSSSQQTTLATGGDTNSATGSIAFSIGQVVYSSATSATLNINQGVQQPYEFFNVSVFETNLNFSFSVFPNPADNEVILEITGLFNENLSYVFVDIHGQIIDSKAIASSKTEICISHLPPATYFIYVMQQNMSVAVFKIIKS
jgi:hypothetical protein